MGDYLYHGSDCISVKNNKIQYNNEYAVKGFSLTNFIVAENIYRCNGIDEQQEYLSSEKKLQLERLNE